jgi:uncharacterized membrane protein
MGKARIEAFTDGVLAIVITIMVLELKVPHGADFMALRDGAPVFLAYVLSFVNIGIFWNNHHHMLHATGRIGGCVLWLKLALLLFLSLVPFVIRWVDEVGLVSAPVAAYGIVLTCAAISYTALQNAIIACNADSILPWAIGSDWKGKASLSGYIAAIPLAFVSLWLSIAIYVAIAAAWFIPDQRIERAMRK